MDGGMEGWSINIEVHVIIIKLFRLVYEVTYLDDMKRYTKALYVQHTNIHHTENIL